MSAIKLDTNKPRVDLLFTPGGLQIARALEYGARKYEDPYNYASGDGLAYSRLVAAAGRHLTAFYSGEDLDPESGLPHLACAGASVKMLLDLVAWGRGVDDRWRP